MTIDINSIPEKPRVAAFKARNISIQQVTTLFFVLCAIFLLAQLTSYPLMLWDESRSAVNAIEMAGSGLSIVTTYNHLPDLWNTKPPLMIWLQALLIQLIGPSILAVRLPSAVAGIGTLILVVFFAQRFARTRWAPFLAALFLMLSPLFYGLHGAATGDYDTLLTLFTTSYLIVLFEAIRCKRPAPRRIWTAALLVFAAYMTKGIAGLMPLAGFLTFAAITGRLGRLFKLPHYLIAGIVTLASISTFLAWREAVAPGYIAATWQNEILGRFFIPFEQHGRSALHYFWHGMGKLNFMAGPLACVAFVGPFITRGRARLGIIYCLAVAAAFIFLISVSATRITWYALPAYPFLAVALALTIEEGMAMPKRWRALAAGALIASLIVSFGFAIYSRYRLSSNPSDAYLQNYDLMFNQISKLGIDKIHVVDGGVFNSAGIPHYAPMLRFYAIAHAKRGLHVLHYPSLQDAPKTPGTLLASCDQDTVRASLVAAAGIPLQRDLAQGCVAVLIK